jgi:hypothetical protein
MKQMRAIDYKFVLFLLVMAFLAPSVLHAQEKKSNNKKVVCSMPVPSRFSTIKASKSSSVKANITSSKTRSCCKGAPSRFSAKPAGASQQKKQLMVQK